MFGYGLSYGESTGTSWFTAMGSWFLDESGPMQGPTFTVFLFQMSFATTATTIGLLYFYFILCKLYIDKHGIIISFREHDCAT